MAVNFVGYTRITATNTATGTSAPIGNDCVIYGVGIKAGATALQLDLYDGSTAVMPINSVAANSSVTQMFPVGVKFKTNCGVGGTATNLGYVTLFYQNNNG
jgi:hypothetical protein